MKTHLLRTAFPLAFVCLLGAATASAQTDPHAGHAPSPTPSPSARPTPRPTPAAAPAPAATPSNTPAAQTGGEGSGQGNLSPGEDWPSPVDDEMKHTFLLADVLEIRPGRDGSDFRWDVEGWHGGDFNRVWFKSEGESDTAFKAEYDVDLQLLYGRFVKRFYDFQVGARVETHGSRGSNATRVHAVVGLEGLVPYRYEFESALFVSHRGDVSGRVSFTRDYLLTQRWVLQGRVETNVAAQRVERFGVGRGLNNVEAGLRLRREFHRRKVGPYFGVSFERSFFGTADLVRQDGGDPSQVRFVAGVRLWR
jgi:copper resistance protein B